MLAYKSEADSIPLNKEIGLPRGGSYLDRPVQCRSAAANTTLVQVLVIFCRDWLGKISHLEKGILLQNARCDPLPQQCTVTVCTIEKWCFK